VNRAFIASAGALCAVGLTLPQTAAAVRAGLMLFEAGPLYGPNFEPFTLAQLPEDALPALSAETEATTGLTSRELRLLRLAARPLQECASALGADASRVRLLLTLPERETPIPMKPELLLTLLAAQAPGTFDVSRSAATWRGRAGGLVALGTAVELVRSGQESSVLVGAVDTFRDPWLLATLHADGRVKSSKNLDGFVPGEGAAFVLIAKEPLQSSAPLAHLSAVSFGEEPGHFGSPVPYLGEGLANVVAPLVAHLSLPAPIRTIWSTMNGESHWGKEWGVTYLRNSAAFDPDHAIEHPADCVGDMGAALGVLTVALAAYAQREGHANGPALCYASNDGALRAALAVLPS
jgi:3-oxoacyl-[acyl-carrier-protein] synthase I